ncbi:MAG: hypothetical protein JKY88_05330 [Pseudomonadales bacterium]|nr:hypothetical protein [Pseudomonadales bacterium]
MAKKKYAREGRYFAFHEEILSSNAYRDLDCVSRCLLVEFVRVCFPLERNGRLSISTANAAARLNIHRDTAAKAFYQLTEHGFIILRKGEFWQQRQARKWALTILPEGKRREPADDWKQWKLGSPVFEIPTRKKTVRQDATDESNVG